MVLIAIGILGALAILAASVTGLLIAAETEAGKRIENGSQGRPTT